MVIGNSATLVRFDLRTNCNVASLTFPLRSGRRGRSEGTIWAATDWTGTNQPDTIERVNPQAVR